MKQMDPEERDAEMTRRIQHLLYAPRPENVRSWLAWYRYFREGGATAMDALFSAWQVAQPVRRRVSDAWWWVKIPFLSVYEALRDTWRDNKGKNDSNATMRIGKP